jgi:dienelactone hydrolase
VKNIWSTAALATARLFFCRNSFDSLPEDRCRYWFLLSVQANLDLNRPMHRFACVLILALLAACPIVSVPAADLSPVVQNLNTLRTFPPINDRAHWANRAREIREQILVSCGLWPLPDRSPLRPQIFGRIDREGYSVEKVYFETYPGFYLAGNLYRPLGRGTGKFPGVLNPHGHWKGGRLEDTSDCSAAARCIGFARQGMIAFSYDMVGYNDTRFTDSPTNRPFYEGHSQFGTNRTDQLWSISLMGLQMWNSLRALDFLASLPDVNPQRLACTGESGGGTQTFMLGAVDDRLAAQAPVVMVSHSMQGGCVCENVPGLRVEYSNMEIAAAAAPRPQLLVAATGDWTRMTLEIEGPAIAKIYALFGAGDRFRYERFDFRHNYNQTSREAVYTWFGRWLLDRADGAVVKEQAYEKEADADLRVFAADQLPAGALTQAQLIAWLKEQHRERWHALQPKNRKDVENFARVMRPAWAHTLLVNQSALDPVTSRSEPWPGSSGESGGNLHRLIVSHSAGEREVTASYFAARNPDPKRPRQVVVLADDGDGDKFMDSTEAPREVVGELVRRGISAIVIRRYSTGEVANQFTNHFTTYNRTKVQERVGDLIAVCQAARSLDLIGSPASKTSVTLCGMGPAGLWSVLAAPEADAVVADCAAVDATSDEALLVADLFCPGLRTVGTFEGAAMLAAPHPLRLHNTGENFPTRALQSVYQITGATSKLSLQRESQSAAGLVKWLAER